MASELKWLDEDLDNYGVVQLDIPETHQDTPLTLKAVPTTILPEKFSLKETFQIDTSMVLNRLKKAMWPPKAENFFEEVQPDLYSPFWIITTLILLISTASAMQTHSIGVLVTSASLYYTMVLAVPGAIYCLLSHNGSGMQYYHIISIYGYSFVHFLYPTIVSFFVHWTIRWAVWAVAAGISLWFLHKNMWAEIEKCLQSQKIPIAIAVSCGHMCLVVSANMYFFKG